MGKDLKGHELGAYVCQRKNGAYMGTYIDRFGKKKYIYNRDLKELKDELVLRRAENIKNISCRQDMTLSEWFGLWVETYKKRTVRPNTLAQYVSLFHKNIEPMFGGYKLEEVKKSDVQRLIDILDEEGYGYERQNKVKVVLNDMFSRAMEDELANHNPTKGVKLRAVKDKKARALTKEEQEEFFDVCRGTFYDPLFNVAVNTGLRPGELYALTFDDLNFNEGYINVNKTLVYQKYLDDKRKEFHIEEPKTKQSIRKVPMNSICREYLKKQLQIKEIVSHKSPKEQNDNIFVTKFNTRLNSVIYAAAINVIVKEINLTRSEDDKFEKFSGHTFRHTFATRCFEAGVDAKVVQHYLGHASIKMTLDLYTHVTEEKSADDIERIVPEKNNVVEFKSKIS
jgi:integrase